MLLREIYGARQREYKKDASRWPDLFGIELELEGIDKVPAFDYWSAHEDGSLRNGIEFVLNQPYGGPTLEDAIHEYYNADVTSACTERASTHIHINMTDSTVEHLRSMMILMYVIEGPLFTVVGEARKWCGYAMPLSEMEPKRFAAIMQSDDALVLMRNLSTGRNQDRYYGLNISSVRKWGTAEFRYFPGDPSRTELAEWLDLVYAVKKTAHAMSPQQIVDAVDSPVALAGLLNKSLGREWTDKLIRASSLDEMYASFNSVAMFVQDGADALRRNEPLVFVTPALLRYAVKHVVGEKGRAYMEEVGKTLGVVSRADWSYHLDTARNIGNKKAAAKKAQPDFGEYLYNPEPVARARDYAQIAAAAVRNRRDQAINPFAQYADRVPAPEPVDDDENW